jgi:hypothetical protein
MSLFQFSSLLDELSLQPNHIYKSKLRQKFEAFSENKLTLTSGNKGSAVLPAECRIDKV